MRSRWSSKAAKKQADQYQNSVKNIHPDTRVVIRAVFTYVQINQRITFHGIPNATRYKVIAELRALGYEVIAHGQFSPDTIKIEVRVV